MKSKVKKIYNSFLNILKLPEMRILPGQLAFYMLMSFVPILAICTMIVSYTFKNLDMANLITSFLPESLSSVIIPYMVNQSSSISVFVLFALYLFASTNGVKSIIITSNALYKEENKNIVSLLLKSFIMTIILIILLIFIIAIPVFGNTIIKFIYRLLGSPKVLLQYVGLLKIIKILVSFLFIYISVKLLYILAPDSKIKSKTTTKGAIFTTFSWIIVTEGFGFYLTNLARYNELYGNFANILVLLIWLNLLAYLFVVGMALNINSYHNQNLGSDKDE